MTAALVDALKTRRSPAPGSTSPIPSRCRPIIRCGSAPNVIITPHVANDSDLGFDAQIAVVEENLRRYASGRTDVVGGGCVARLLNIER